MGYDIYGLSPKNSVGHYFRASIFEWPEILDYIAATGVLSEEALQGISYNDGYEVGADDARRLADALEFLLESDGEPKPVPVATRVLAFATDLEVFFKQAGFTTKTLRPTSTETTRERVREFIEFLRASDGFVVW